MSQERKIHVLDKVTASKIAAGEVIDRTSSVVRELLDNAIDAGATEIAVYLTGGGIKEIRVIDNGCGMSKEDLDICFLPHSTSKLSSADDLFNIMTMGFRGEALASIAASAKVEITTSETGEIGYGISIDGGKVTDLGAVKANKGTVVSVRELFCYLPARRKFLKSPAAETSSCRTVFYEKALAFPDITFKLFLDGKLTSFLPAGSLKKRIADAYPSLAPEKLYHQVEAKCEGYSVTILFPGVEVVRRDRRDIHIYVNSRPIQEFALVQAVCYGLSAYFPGGTYPAAFLFIQIDPSLVDFNIHPAKREVKINNLPMIHRTVVEALKQHMGQLQKPAGSSDALYPKDEDIDTGIQKPAEIIPSYRPSEPVNKTLFGPEKTQMTFSPASAPSSQSSAPASRSFSNLLKDKPDVVSFQPSPEYHGDFRYLGQIFDSFLLCERDDSLYIIDQHASQERFYFDLFLSQKPEVHQLLIPYNIECESQVAELIEKEIPKYAEIGVIIKKDETGQLYIDAMPSSFFELKNDVLNLLVTQTGDFENIKTELYARAACKKALKAGDAIDYDKAIDLIKKVFAMPMPRCPHGRPLYWKLTKDKLYQLLERTV
ncbi:MAG: DNA mismatch repair endonuclease MutL [Spirochaetia bacterium]|nr:DNA mismatch repair endonuclease MutL [Spirochaetia bacterium]